MKMSGFDHMFALGHIAAARIVYTAVAARCSVIRILARKRPVYILNFQNETSGAPRLIFANSDLANQANVFNWGGVGEGGNGVFGAGIGGVNVQMLGNPSFYIGRYDIPVADIAVSDLLIGPASSLWTNTGIVLQPGQIFGVVHPTAATSLSAHILAKELN